MSSSNCCFLTCIQISQEAGQVVWYSHLLQNFPQFIVIHTVKGFGVVNEAEVDDLYRKTARPHARVREIGDETFNLDMGVIHDTEAHLFDEIRRQCRS